MKLLLILSVPLRGLSGERERERERESAQNLAPEKSQGGRKAQHMTVIHPLNWVLISPSFTHRTQTEVVGGRDCHDPVWSVSGSHRTVTTRFGFRGSHQTVTVPRPGLVSVAHERRSQFQPVPTFACRLPRVDPD